jgi:hypothetical protein
MEHMGGLLEVGFEAVSGDENDEARAGGAGFVSD